MIAGAFLFLVIDWQAIDLVWTLPFIAVDVDRLFVEGSLGWPALMATVGFVAVANLLVTFVGRLEEERRRFAIVCASVVANLGILGFFKYFDFFVASAEAVVASFGFQPESFRLNIILPVGISFYTFQTLSYTIDIYRRRFEPTTDYLSFSLFIAYFPQLVAGPIERAANLLPRLQVKRQVGWDDIAAGSYLILLGLVKKVAIADGLGPAVASVFNSSGTPSWFELIVASSMFAVQLYCDFSGYSDIARGTSRLMGIPLMLNFRMPLLAASPSDFFARWHLSLTTWLRDYVYESLGRNRRRAEMYRSLFLTMTIGGLWHGAGWTFVAWGAFEGLLLVLDRRYLGRRLVVRKGAHGFGHFFRRLPFIMTFFYVHLIAAILFRSGDWDRAVTLLGVYFTDIGNLAFSALTPTLSAIVGIVLVMSIEVVEYARDELEIVRRAPIWARSAVYAAMIFLIAMGTANETKQFVYFQF